MERALESTPKMRASGPAKKTNRFRSRGLRAAALGVGATAVAGEAGATIIYDLASTYSTGQTFSITGDAYGEITLQSTVNGMGETSLSLTAPAAAMMGISSTVQFGTYQPNGMMGTHFLLLEPSGFTVDGSLNVESNGYLIDRDVVDPGWAPGTTGYMGFSFDPDGAGTTYGTVFGWAEVNFIDGSNFTVSQWAYDDTGAPIGIGVIPEPSTAVLLGLGLAGLAVAGRRRVRRSALTTHG